jgi:hypothetical protein
VIAAESGGRVVVAWLDGSRNPWVDWSQWTPGRGFGAVDQLHGAHGSQGSNLVASPAGAGVELAWIEGDFAGGAPGQYVDPIWVSRRGATGGFSAPVRAYRGLAGQLSLAGAAGVVALAFSSASPDGGGYADDARGALVERSVGGRPFGPPVELDPRAGPNPTVAVAPDGDVLAAWGRSGSDAPSDAKLAAATPSGPFGAPLALGSDSEPYGPWVVIDGPRALVTWQDQAATDGVTARP